MKEIFKLEDLLGTFIGYLMLHKGMWFSPDGKDWAPVLSWLNQYELLWDNIIFQRCLCINEQGQAVFQDDTINSRYGEGIVADYCQATGTLYFKVGGQIHHSHLAHVELTEQALVVG